MLITVFGAGRLASVYNGTGATLPLSRSGTEAAVRQYAADAELADRFEGFDVAGVETDGVTVTVTLRAAVPLPFVNLISSRWTDGYPVRAVARALTGDALRRPPKECLTVRRSVAHTPQHVLGSRAGS